MIRVLHFSDVHVQEALTSMPVNELMGKRLLAACNLWLVRGKLFKDTIRKLEALGRFAEAERVDLALCTGDYTALGSEAEHESARRALGVLERLPLGYATVPGNHDLYLADAVRDARFERHFGDLQRSDLPEHAADGAYPFVRLCGAHLALVGVNSARPNPNPFSSAGRVPDAQLEALARVLDDARVRSRFVIVMTHYGLLRRNGKPDSVHHGLENGDALMRICARTRVALAHGHLHWRYAHAATSDRPWMFCSGSATHAGREGLWVYEVEASVVRAVPGHWTGSAYALDRAAAVIVSSE